MRSALDRFVRQNAYHAAVFGTGAGATEDDHFAGLAAGVVVVAVDAHTIEYRRFVGMAVAVVFQRFTILAAGNFPLAPPRQSLPEMSEWVYSIAMTARSWRPQTEPYSWGRPLAR